MKQSLKTMMVVIVSISLGIFLGLVAIGAIKHH